ncbi:MAG TPA: hypothetical protein VEJ84_23445, partial [Acidimicrobiales bacterium]|nr:hypothetical protein [Acidimicrobiales bacterium]
DYANLFERKLDELATLFRGMFRAGLDGFRVISDSASEFYDDVLEADTPEADDTPRDTLRRVPQEFFSGLSRALDRDLDAPRRAVNQFNHTYQHEPKRRSVRRSSADEAYADWATSDLRREATAQGISDADDLTRNQLLSRLEATERQGAKASSTATSSGTTGATSSAPKP